NKPKNYEEVIIADQKTYIVTGSSMAFHEGRMQLSGGSECQGEVEIYFRQDWRRVLLDSWSLSEASVLCRQLGCGSVLNYRSSPSTTENKHMCVTGFSCSGSEAHLGNCSSAQPVNCSSGEQLYITCSGRAAPNPPSAVAPPTPPLVLFVLGTLLFLALVLLLVLFYQNRVLRRVVSKTRRKTQPEAVYEEINHRYITRRITSSTQRGSLLSEELHSGYEHVDDELLSVKSGFGEKAEYYDDVIDTSDFISDTGRVEPPEDYDDAVTAGPIPDNLEEDEAENYDEAITADQKSVLLTEDVSENYDDAVTAETNTNITTDNPEDYDDVITEEQDGGETE
ncbi:scavenger receptor cysteine-rich type 23, partial [Clarias magur]